MSWSPWKKIKEGYYIREKGSKPMENGSREYRYDTMERAKRSLEGVPKRDVRGNTIIITGSIRKVPDGYAYVEEYTTKKK